LLVCSRPTFQGKKKFVIKPFRSHTAMDGPAAQQIWSGLESAISEIHNQDASLLSFEELYRNAYNLVLHKHGEILYQGVSDCVSRHLAEVADAVQAVPDSTLLAAVSKVWSDHQLKMTMVRDSICMYMDRTYVAQKKKKPVYELALGIFRRKIFEHPNVRDRLPNILLRNVENERQGQLIERSLMKNVLGMLVEIGAGDGGGAGAGANSDANSSHAYNHYFENLFLAETEEFYKRESRDYLSKNSAPDYVRKAERRLNEEQSRVANYLSSTSEAKLMASVENQLIATHAVALVSTDNSGCISMLQDDKVEDLRNMYDLFTRVASTVEILRDAVCDHVKKTGRALVTDQERVKDPVVFFKGVLAMREKYDRIVDVSFRGEKKAQKKLKEAFEYFINADSRAALYLAIYVDELMRSGLKGANEQEVDVMLDKSMVIFRYLQDKDVFENFFKQHLAKRLLTGKSISDEAEKSMVAKLKTECGYQYTSKLEGMFTDMRISKDTMDSYKRAAREGAAGTGDDKGKVDLDVDVLTTGFWPSQAAAQCNLPAAVSDAIGAFEKFYLQKHTGRKLAWQTATGTAEIRGTFGEGRKHDLVVSTYQMCILVLFNESPTKTLKEIAEATNIPDGELRRHLISLCTPKHRILKKASKGKAIEDDDSFTFNADFTCKLKRVKVPLVSMKETVKEGEGAGEMGGKAVPKAVEEDRRHLLEAAIVRIMKSRKTLQHHDLVAEVSKQLNSRFAPDPQSIKKRIESLIEREYIERSEEDRKLYTYLA
jgi:cullin 3